MYMYLTAVSRRGKGGWGQGVTREQVHVPQAPQPRDVGRPMPHHGTPPPDQPAAVRTRLVFQIIHAREISACGRVLSQSIFL